VGTGPDLDALVAELHGRPADLALRAAVIEAALPTDPRLAASLARDALEQAVASDDAEAFLRIGLQAAVVVGDHLLALRFERSLGAWLRAHEVASGRVEEGPAPASTIRSADHPSAKGAPRLELVTGGPAARATGAQPGRQLADVAGLATVKRNLAELVERARTSPTGDEGWLGGMLLYGPPACGKRFCAEVVAGELDAILWPFDLAEAWTAETLSTSLGAALATAGEHRIVIHFANADSPGAAALVEPLLPRLDHAMTTRSVVVLGAATYPWLVTPRLVRPGRLGRVLLVLPPDAPARELFVQRRAEGRIRLDDADVDWIVAHTEGHSFGDLDRLLDVATTLALAVSGPLTEPVPLVPHLAVRTARQQVLASSAEWLTVAAHHALLNEEGGLYDDLLTYFHFRQHQLPPSGRG